MVAEVVLTNNTGEKPKVLSTLMTFAADNNLPEKAIQAADLALEEHITNIINYGYEDSARHEIRVRLSISNGSLIVEVDDDGRAFNPLEAPTVDTTIPLAERRIGGLGIHLMRSFMDDLVYQRVDGRNILKMTKSLKA